VDRVLRQPAGCPGRWPGTGRACDVAASADHRADLHGIGLTVMTAREPSDAEVEAAFNDSVARPTGRDGLDDSWADQHPLFADDAGSSGPNEVAESGTDWSGTDWSGTDRSGAGRPGTDGPDGPTDDGPVLRGEVLDPAPVPGPDDDPVDEQEDEPLGWRVHRPPDDEDLDELDLDELPRTPLPPWRPSPTAISALVLITAAVIVTVLMIAQVWLPWWAGWGALGAFLAGMGLLFSRLPRDRDEDPDDGAVV